MPQTIVEIQSYSKPRKCDVPVSNYATFGKGDESPTGSDSSDDLFTNSLSSKNDSCDRRDTVNDKEIHPLSELAKDICNRGNKHHDLDLFPPKTYGEYYAHCDLGLKNSYNDIGQFTEFKEEPFKSNMRVVHECEILGDGLRSSVSSPSKVSYGFSFKSNSGLDASKIPKSNGLNLDFFKSSSKNSKDGLKCEDSNFEIASVSSDSSLFAKDIPVPSVIRCDPELSNANSYCRTDESEILGDFSDLLSSISSPSEVSNGFSSNSNYTGDDSKMKSQNSSVLSDILLSIDINDDEPKQSKLNSSLQSSDSNLCFEDLFLGGDADGLKQDYKSQSNGTASDLFLPLPFKDDSTQRKLKSPILAPDTNFRLENTKVPISNGFGSDSKQTTGDSLSDFLSLISHSEYHTNDTSAALNGITKSDTQNALLTSLLDFNVDNHRSPTSSMSVPKPTGRKQTIHNQKNGEFSFFSVSPDSGFSDMVSKFKKDVGLQNNATDDNSTGISMLDLFKSVNSDSSSSLSEYLSTESEGSLTDKSTPETERDFCEIMDIDLSSCVKTNIDNHNVTSEEAVMEDCTDAYENDHVELQLGSFMFKAFPETDGLKRKRIKFKQGLFAKSLSCKYKKNPILLQEVARIKSGLFEKYFNQPFPDFAAEKSVAKDLIVSQANNCMVTFNGRRVCTSNGLEDVTSN